MRAFVGSLTLVFLLVSVPPQPAEAQRLDRRPPGWLSVDGYLTSYQLDAPLEKVPSAIMGGGLRVMVSAAPITGLDFGFLHRTSIGPYLTFTPRRDNTRTWHFGGQLDFRILPSPLGGFIDPHLSIGAGAFRIDTPDEPVQTPAGELTVSETFGTFVPGGGLRLRIARGLALRGDLRDVIIFGEETTHNWEFSGGLSLLF